MAIKRMQTRLTEAQKRDARNTAPTSQIGAFSAGDGPAVFTSASIAASGTTLSADVRTLHANLANAKGVWVSIQVTDQTVNRYIFCDASGVTQDAPSSPRLALVSGANLAGQLMVPLGSDGKIQLSASNTVTGVNAWVTGWWT